MSMYDEVEREARSDRRRYGDDILKERSVEAINAAADRADEMFGPITAGTPIEDES